jgi:hypothetical protein
MSGKLLLKTAAVLTFRMFGEAFFTDGRGIIYTGKPIGCPAN